MALQINMKQFILTMGMTALTAITFGQDLRMDEVDEFTNRTIKVTKSYKVGKRGLNSLYMSIRRVDDSYGIEFWSSLDQGCAGSNNNYTILLGDDGSNIEFKEDLSRIDCSDQASSVYVLDIDMFTHFNITKIRFAQSNSYDDFEYTGEYTIQELIGAVQ